MAQERKAQNAQLIKQREDYVRKARVLKRELELLRNQKHDIMSENSSQRDMQLILKENIKLQVAYTPECCSLRVVFIFAANWESRQLFLKKYSKNRCMYFNFGIGISSCFYLVFF